MTANYIVLCVAYSIDIILRVKNYTLYKCTKQYNIRDIPMRYYLYLNDLNYLWADLELLHRIGNHTGCLGQSTAHALSNLLGSWCLSWYALPCAGNLHSHAVNIQCNEHS